MRKVACLVVVVLSAPAEASGIDPYFICSRMEAPENRLACYDEVARRQPRPRSVTSPVKRAGAASSIAASSRRNGTGSAPRPRSTDSAAVSSNRKVAATSPALCVPCG